MKSFTIILCMIFFQLSYASVREDKLDLLKEELKKIMREHFEKLKIIDRSSEELEFLDSYTQNMKKAYLKFKEADISLYLQVQDIKSLKEMIGREADFGIPYTLKVIEKIGVFYNQLAKLQAIMNVIDHSNYLSIINLPELRGTTFQQLFRTNLNFLSELIFKISLQLKFLEKHQSPLRAIDIVRKIFTSEYEKLHLNMKHFIETLETYIKSE